MSNEDFMCIKIKNELPVFYDFLSPLGRRIYFPLTGIMAQSKEAKVAKINASIGIALKDNKKVLCLNSIANNVLLDANRVFPYTSSFGDSKLRENWKNNIIKKNSSLNQNLITNPVITSGLTHALSVVGRMFCDKGCEIIIPDLYWGNYKLIFEVSLGAKLLLFPFFNGDKFNIIGLKNLLIEKERAILLFNFPNNPTGYSLTQNEQEELISLIFELANKGKQLLVICDDAYFGLFYEKDVAKESLFAKLCGLHENIVVVKVDGPTKENYVWGLRVGSITLGNKNMTYQVAGLIENKLAGLIRSSISCASSLSQSLVVTAEASKTIEFEKQIAYELLKSRYNKVKETFLEHPEYLKVIKVLPCNSGYFCCVKLINLVDCEEVRRVLLEKYSIGLIAIADKNLLRIAFSCISVDEISEVIDKVYLVVKQLAYENILSEK